MSFVMLLYVRSSWLKVVCMVLELAFELSTRWDVILRMLSAKKEMCIIVTYTCIHVSFVYTYL